MLQPTSRRQWTPNMLQLKSRSQSFCIFTLILLQVFVTSAAGECRAALGMEEGRIPDTAISASSTYELKSVGPQNARLRQELNGGAWCPKAQISSEVREFLEVDLGRDHLVTWTETQGRFGNGQGQEYAEAFLVEYWRAMLGRWTVYRNSEGKKILQGNSNTYLVVRQELDLPFVASKVRFIPYSQHPRTVCMRVELYGCSWEQSVISYTAPEGETEGDLNDLSYDGVRSNGVMRGGLGQLVDSLYGPEDFLQRQPSGNRWLGWLNESQDGPLEILFQFDTAREFSMVHLHTNHYLARDVQVLSSVDGRYVRSAVRDALQLVALMGNVTEEILEQFYQQQQDIGQEDKPATGGETTHARKEVTPATSPASNTQAYIGLATGVLAMVVLLLACTVLFMVRRGRKKVALLHKHTALVSNTAKPGVTINMKELKMNMSTPIINNSLNTSRSRHSIKVSKSTSGGLKAAVAGGGIYGHMAVGEESEDSENSSVYHEPYKLLPNGKQEYGCLLLKKDAINNKSTVSDYAGLCRSLDLTSVKSFQEDVKFSPSLYNLTPPPPPPPATRPPPYECAAPRENYYAATDIIKTERREQHLSPGKVTPLKLPDGSPENVTQLPEFTRHRLRVIEKMGEGSFGMVHLCEAEGVPELNGMSSFHKKQVVVKSLWRGCNESTKQEFMRETEWLGSLKDANVVRVVGVCSQEEPYCVLQEHCEFGDLPTFLQLQAGAPHQQDNPTLSYGCLIYLATQAASGMKYLEAIDVVHRDLAARNCMIGKNYLLKISDHAMFCSQYDGDYYLSDTKTKLPIRWMAWESLLLGKHSAKSDVWSFAVLLWEILVLCGQRPFAELTDEQVVENCNHWYQGNGSQRLLSRPQACPREIYDLMGECWKRHEADRPRFTEIHLFLQRKNLGYVPAIG
ncbi:discoidin domain-containing receptor 2 [Nilaparvata lugens]|uniref:discoidin domain-containing receptor 2 n=1 Tax=Nilaparvata lugens TaxID=108931 RepID=UPI00193D539A|nr:discoidin domain-containing receptor 2 [Nilaparvata lugens]